jgi:cell division protein FtsZ
VKGFSTEMSLEVTSLGVQVHGGMGFIEETGAAQYYRDAKILTIYEGTTAIQANDLVGRKTSRDGGNTAKAIAAQIANTESELKKQNSAHALAVAKKLGAACQAFEEVVDFIVANTDAQALKASLAPHKIQLGKELTKGLGAGADPDIGRDAALEDRIELQEFLSDADMVFITAGMGGGTGTGAAPVVARIAKERGILTVGVVTKPFQFEGAHRMRSAEAGIAELQHYVDTLIIIPNQNLFRIANDRTTFADAFKMADDVLHAGVRGVTDLMMMRKTIRRGCGCLVMLKN